MKKGVGILIVAVFVSLIIGAMVGIFIKASLPSLTGQVVSAGGTYSWTTALCNKKHECIDVVIMCENGKVVSIDPVSQLLKFDDSFIDNRNITSFCE